MGKVIHLTAEQIVNLRNNWIITEALAEPDTGTETAELADDYKDYAVSDVNRQPNDPLPTKDEKQESVIYGDIAKGLYNYSQIYNLSNKIATEIEQANENISAPMAKHFIDKLLYGIYQMANDPSQNEAFERFLRSIGVTLNAQIITKDNELGNQ